MRRRNLIVIGIFLLFYVAFGFFLTLNQERVVYQPGKQDFHECPALNTADAVTFRNTRMYVADLAKPVAVLYHGNAGSACDRSFYADLFSAAGYGYILVEYAGYSNDPRITTHELVKQDVVNVTTYLKAQQIEPAAVVGESVGTGAATYHTTLAPPEKLLLITPFTDLVAVAQKRFWFYPTTLLVDNAFDNVENLKTYNGRVTIIHGTNDTIIPIDLGQQLFSTLETERQFVAIPEAGHNDLFRYTKTRDSIKHFLLSQ